MSRTTNGQLDGQTVVVIGGSAGIGLETARIARAEGAELVLTARNPARLREAAESVGGARTAAFDATDFAALGEFFAGLGAPVDHVLVTGPGPYYARLPDIDLSEVRKDLESHVLLPIEVARNAIGRVRAGGTLLFMGGTGGRKAAVGFATIGTLTAGMPALVRNLAVELAPVRVNLIAAGFVDTPLSATLLGDQLDERRAQLRATLPVRRTITAQDVAHLAVHLMVNTALTGGTYDIDGGQQLVDG